MSSRVVTSPGDALEAALSRSLTGYAVLEPAGALLVDDGASGVLTFEAGVPVCAHVPGSDAGGPAALGELAEPGPVRAELYAASTDALAAVHAGDAYRIAPDGPARELAGDAELAARTRERAPGGDGNGEDGSALEAFLADEAGIERLRAEARAEARAQAASWGLTPHVEAEGPNANADADADADVDSDSENGVDSATD